MGFFETIFGKKMVEKKTVVLELQKMEEFLDEKAIALGKEIEKPVFSKVSQIKHLLGEIKAQLEVLKKKEVSMNEGNARLRKVVKTSQASLFLQLNTLIKKLEPPESSELTAIMDYTFDSSKTLSQGISSSRKNIAYAQTILGAEIKGLGKTVNELDVAFKNLNGIFEKSSLKEILAIKKSVKNFDSYFSEKDSMRRYLTEKELELDTFNKKREKLSNQLTELKNSKEMATLKSIRNKKGDLFQKKRVLRDRFVSLMEKIEKPMHRFLKLAASKKYILPQEEQELLNLYTNNFFFAIKKDPKAVALKKLLLEIEKLVVESVIVLKEKEMEKKLFALRELAEFDFYNKIFWRLSSIDSEIVLLDEKIKNSFIEKKVSSLENEFNHVEREISEKKVFLNSIPSKIAVQEEKILALKEAIEKNFKKIFKQNIVIKIPA